MFFLPILATQGAHPSAFASAPQNRCHHLAREHLPLEPCIAKGEAQDLQELLKTGGGPKGRFLLGFPEVSSLFFSWQLVVFIDRLFLLVGWLFVFTCSWKAPCLKA